MAYISEISDIHKIINKVQIHDSEQKCEVQDVTLIPIIENIVKDSCLLLKKEKSEDQIIYTIMPSDVKFGKHVKKEELEDDFFNLLNDN